MNNVRISESNLKPICSVRELAEDILGLSRQHFYNLQRKGIFPQAVYDIRTRRPYFPISLQKICIGVRNTNIGYNGQPVLFYGPRKQRPKKTVNVPPSKRASHPQEHLELVQGLKAMGMVNVSVKDVDAALKVVCPEGVNQTDQGVILRGLYRYMKGLA